LRFAFVIFKYFPFGGVQRDMLRIAQDCAALGHQVDIYTGQWRGEKPQHAAIKVKQLTYSGWLNHQRHNSLIQQIQQCLSQQKYDLVLGFNRMPNLDAYFVADPCYAERMACKPYTWLNKLSGRYHFFRGCEEAVFGGTGAGLIFLLSERDRAIFQNWYDTANSRFSLLTPHLPYALFEGKKKTEVAKQVRQNLGLPEDAKLVLTVGSAYYRKGVDRMLLAMASLPQALRQRTWLLAVGEYESSNQFKKDAQQLKVEDCCLALGGRDDVADLMLAADVFAHPARSELAGIVIIEAILAETPTLVTGVCGYANHVQYSNCGIVLPEPFQQDTFNKSLVSILTSFKVNQRKRKNYLASLPTQNMQEALQLEAYAKNKQTK